MYLALFFYILTTNVDRTEGLRYPKDNFTCRTILYYWYCRTNLTIVVHYLGYLLHCRTNINNGPAGLMLPLPGSKWWLV